jgi:Ca2+-binding EF-hand superfamily protein
MARPLRISPYDGGKAMRIGNVLAVFVLAGCGGAPAAGERGPERMAFEELDDDDDEQLDNEEFFHTTLRYYDDWDVDQDGELTNHELALGVFASWDENGDGRVEPREYGDGSFWRGRAHSGEFARWDRDGNGWLDRDEASDRLVSVFDAYDADASGRVTDLELNDALFREWDADEDGRVEPREWRVD